MTEAEAERAGELMDEGEILEDLLDELGPDDVFFDIGANVGLYSLFVAQEADSVVAFEPHPENLDALEWNLDRNGVSATVVRGVLSDHAGKGRKWDRQVLAILRDGVLGALEP